MTILRSQTAPTPACVFCSLPEARVVRSSPLTLVVRDAYPVSPGHTLLIPRRHVVSFFDTHDDEQADLFRLLAEARRELLETLRPDGFNIGINDGEAAGQTVMHLHIHLIPRYVRDRQDPRGGVRWVLPDKADYWSRA